MFTFCLPFKLDQMNFKVTIVYRKDKPNKMGACPINIRLTYRRKVQYFATGYLVYSNEWDASKLRVVKSKNSWRHLESPDKMNYNINSEYQRIYRSVENTLIDNPSLNFAQLKNTIKSIKNQSYDFYNLANEIIEGYKVKNSFGTYDKCTSFINKLKKFSPHLELHDVTLSFINAYEDYLRNGKIVAGKNVQKANSTNTIHSNLKFIRQVLNEAVRRDLLTSNDNPFQRKTLQTAKTSRVFLSIEMLNKLRSLELVSKRLSEVRDMFVFSSYTGGVRLSDLLLLKVGDFTETHLSFKVRKTQDQMHIKLTTISKEIFSRYSNGKGEDEYLFNIIPNDCDQSDPQLLDKQISVATTTYNNNLKRIAVKLNWTVNLTSHAARHTFATLALSTGIDVYLVSKLLGHQSVKQTEIYLKVVNQQLDGAMDRLN